MKVILSNTMQSITNQQNHPLAILGQKYLTGLKIQSRSKNRVRRKTTKQLLSLNVSTGQG
jgi:hypothetical protein